MQNIPDHHVIRNMERYGTPDGKAPEYPVCPKCGKQPEDFIRNKYTKEIVGCDRCTEPVFWERMMKEGL